MTHNKTGGDCYWGSVPLGGSEKRSCEHIDHITFKVETVVFYPRSSYRETLSFVHLDFLATQ